MDLRQSSGWARIATHEPVAAEDFPSRGFAYGGTDRDAIQYNCNRQSTTETTCKFMQMKVRYKAKPEDLEKVLARISEIEQDVRNGKAFGKDECAQFAAIESAKTCPSAPICSSPKD